MYIDIPFLSEVTRLNNVSSVHRSAEGDLTIGIEPPVLDAFQPDAGGLSYPYEVITTSPFRVQELGLPACKVSYLVAAKRCRYTGSDGIVHHFTLPTPGVVLRLGISEAVLELTQRLFLQHGLSMSQALALLRDLYGVHLPTGIAHYFRCKAGQEPSLEGASSPYRMTKDWQG